MPHGVANGILFPYVVKYNEEAAFEKYRKIYNNISTEKKSAEEFSKGMLEQAVRELNKQLGIPAKLSDVGVTREHFFPDDRGCHEKRKHCSKSPENRQRGYSGDL